MADEQATNNQSKVTPTPEVSEGARHVADWQAMRLLNHYRIFLIVAIAAIYYLADSQRTLGQRDAELFEVAHLGYGVFAMLFVYLLRIKRPTIDAQFYLLNYIDIIFIGLLMYASGGVQSGLGPLLLICIALLSQLTSVRYALLFAAIASTVVLAQEMFARLMFGQWAADFERSAVLGGLLFAVAWLMTVPLRRLLLRHVPDMMESRTGLDVKQIAVLNDEIIRELDSGVVVIDSANQVQLINDTARALLASEFSVLPVNLGQLCDSLATSLREAQHNPTLGTRPFTVASTGQAVLPQYIPLSSGGVLIKLDDHAAIRQQFQQLKMASLGRLSASIAHEIRNPLGAISHAVQLMQESASINTEDAELLGIARKHATRINRIIEDVLQLSNRQQIRTDPINLTEHVNAFCERFRKENDLSAERFVCMAEPGVQAIFDPGHLDQVLWNLCTNATLHNDGEHITISIGCWEQQAGVAVIDITDDGIGITDLHREKLFEPFYSTHHSGSGLGLFIIRELCDLNKATIECVDSDVGAHFRIILSTAQEMAA